MSKLTQGRCKYVYFRLMSWRLTTTESTAPCTRFPPQPFLVPSPPPRRHCVLARFLSCRQTTTADPILRGQGLLQGLGHGVRDGRPLRRGAFLFLFLRRVFPALLPPPVVPVAAAAIVVSSGCRCVPQGWLSLALHQNPAD